MEDSSAASDAASETVGCPRCRHQNRADVKFCTQCAFPMGGTSEEKAKYDLMVSSRKRYLQDAKEKINSGRNILFFLAAVAFLLGLYFTFGTDDFASGIANMVVALIYLLLAAWSNKNPFAAILTAFILYITLILLNAIIEPATLFQGVILKAIFIGALIKAITSAREADQLLKQLNNPGEWANPR